MKCPACNHPVIAEFEGGTGHCTLCGYEDDLTEFRYPDDNPRVVPFKKGGTE